MFEMSCKACCPYSVSDPFMILAKMEYANMWPVTSSLLVSPFQIQPSYPGMVALCHVPPDVMGWPGGRYDRAISPVMPVIVFNKCMPSKYVIDLFSASGSPSDRWGYILHLTTHATVYQ